MYLADTANAEIIQETQLPTINLAMLRYQAIFDVYSEEPENIVVRLKQNEEAESLEQIFRFRKWFPNQCAYGWYIYAGDRETLSDTMIIRHVYWNKQEDIDNIHHIRKSTSDGSLSKWPNIKAQSICTKQTELADIIGYLSEIDRILTDGLRFDGVRSSSCEFSDIEVVRRLDWGEIRGTWGPERFQPQVESLLQNMESSFKDAFARSYAPVYQMIFDRICTPDILIKAIYGE